MSDQVVYLMRGLPACGKSHRARRLAGATGVVLETDQYFLTEVGDDPTCYDYDAALLPAARGWNFARFQEAVSAGRTPIVVDRGNGLNQETRAYAVHAVAQGYRVELVEPDSPWWLELRPLLADPAANAEALDAWAHRLAELSRTTHRVSANTIRRWARSWRLDLTVDEILALRE